MPTFLHVGCGQQYKAGTTHGFNTPEWTEVRLDIEPGVEPDILGDMIDMKAVESGSMDAVFSSHNIEHLYPFEVPLALAEFRRVLKPGGFAVITCPDLQSVAALVAEDKLLEPAYESPAGPISPLDIMYGHRPSLARGHLHMAHKCGFTRKVLVGLLNQAGFGGFASMRRPASFDLWAVAVAAEPPASEKAVALAKLHFPAQPAPAN
ncbi:MAG: methyltransferase domain-containing protein [Phenylobacterium sp.]